MPLVMKQRPVPATMAGDGGSEFTRDNMEDGDEDEGLDNNGGDGVDDDDWEW